MKLFKKEQGSFGEVKEVSALSDFCCLEKCYGFMRSVLNKRNREGGFTLAEVLITLGIIGVVAAMTMPALIHSYQQKVLQVQFKKFYATFSNAIKYVQATNGTPMGCYYWDVNPYASNPDKCASRNDYGTCTSWTLSDGSPLPRDYNGEMSDCRQFGDSLMKALNTIKFCESNALANGCLTDKHRGLDKVKKEQNPENEYDPNTTFSDSPMKNRYPAFVTADGTIYVRYSSMSANPEFWVDINGAKAPNKYGYDIFIFDLVGNATDGVTRIKQANAMIEKGGKTFNEMLKK